MGAGRGAGSSVVDTDNSSQIAPAFFMPCVERLPEKHRRLAWPATIIAIFLSLNLFLNYYNKWVLGSSSGDLDLGIPVTYSLIHQLVGFATWSTLFVAFPQWDTRRRDVFEANWKWIALNAFTFATSIAAQNVALVNLPLIVNAVFKSLPS